MVVLQVTGWFGGKEGGLVVFDRAQSGLGSNIGWTGLGWVVFVLGPKCGLGLV